MMTGSRSQKWTHASLGIIGSAFVIFNLVRFNSVVDDAYISFRYLDNWLSGTGLVYNPGERVEGYTNFLWIVLLAPFRLVGLEAELTAFLLSVIFLILLFWAVFRTAEVLAGSTEAGWAAMLLALGSVPLTAWTTSGMETVCFASLLALANQRLASNHGHGLASSVLFGLAALTRPEGLLFAAVAFAAALLRCESKLIERVRRMLVPAIVFVAFPFAHLIFRLFYYGLPLPNTFYAKLGGDLPNMVPAGLNYLYGFLISGGIVVVGCSLLVLRTKQWREWMTVVLLLQVLLTLVYVVWIGGDYFPFHRFLVPVIPALVVLAGVGLDAAARAFGSGNIRLLPAVVLVLTIAQAALAYASSERRSFQYLIITRNEREKVANWLKLHLPPSTLLAINAAGLIPYRTGMRTIDMLGVNDSRIARAATVTWGDGFTKTGHFKHDGAYVCARAPGALVTSGAGLHRGRNAEEAITQAVLNTFPGDREFLRDPACRTRYQAVTEELESGRFLVVYLRQAEPIAASAPLVLPSTAEGWFNYGLSLMRKAELEQAIQAFEKSLELNPEHPPTLTNLGYCLFGLQRYEPAIRIFEKSLKNNSRNFEALYGLALSNENLGNQGEAKILWRRYIDQAPDSPWKDRAREHLALLEGL